MATTHSDDFRPLPGRPASRGAEAELPGALLALAAQAEAAGLDATAARLRAVAKLASAEMVEVRLARLA